MTIRNKLIVLIICILIIPMFFMPVINYYTYGSVIENKVNSSSQQTLAQVSNTMENIIDDMISASNMLSLDDELVSILKERNNLSSWQNYQRESKVIKKITNTQTAILQSYNSDIFVIDFNGNLYSSVRNGIEEEYANITSQNWFKKVVNLNGYMLWMAPGREYMSMTDTENNILMARLIKDDKNAKGYGVVLISLYPDMRLGTLLKTDKQLEESQMILINESGSIILCDNPDETHKTLISAELLGDLIANKSGSLTKNIDKQKTVINYYTIPKTNWKIVQLIPHKSMMKEINQLKKINLTTNGIFLSLLILVAFLISWGITRPLRNLSDLMRKVPEGNFNIRAKIRGNDEITWLSQSFNTMVGEIDSLIKQLKEAYEAREKARLDALQAQINPHFLLNTLNGIKWMATMSGAANVTKMIASLGYLLETTLGKKEEMIPLSEELKCIENYVLIQKMRYGDKFDIEYEIQEELNQYKVPILLLQPLVENAILHGLEDMTSGGLIRIRAGIEDNNTVVEVIDNGKGISPDKLDKLLNISNESNGRFSNIGVKNVNERIIMRYGIGYGLKIFSTENIGTTIRILLPRIKGDFEDVKITNC